MSHLHFILSFDLQNINRNFPLTLKPLNILGGTLFVVCFISNTLFLLFFAVKLVITSAAPTLLCFNVEK